MVSWSSIADMRALPKAPDAAMTASTTQSRNEASAFFMIMGGAMLQVLLGFYSFFAMLHRVHRVHAALAHTLEVFRFDDNIVNLWFVVVQSGRFVHQLHYYVRNLGPAHHGVLYNSMSCFS